MDITNKKLVIFDLDGTLAPSKSPLESDMAELIAKLLKIKKVAVISGGGYPQFQTQILTRLPHDTSFYSNLFMLPASGTSMYTWKGDWHQEYAEEIPLEERKRIISTLENAMEKAGFHANQQKIYGDIIEDRHSQITFSAVGQKAPIEAKAVWDPDHKKRDKIVDLIKDKLSDYDCRIGGMTSIDITRKGVNKSYGIHKLEQHLNMHIDEMVFVGDALFHGGNDYPAKATGVDCIQVKDPNETKELIREWVK